MNLFYNQTFKVCQIGAGFLKKKQIANGHRAATCTPTAKKTIKNGSILGSGGPVNGVKLLIYIGKRVVGGTGLEPVTKAL